MSLTARVPERLACFTADFAAMMDGEPGEPEIVATGGDLLRRLVAQDDWLPEAFAREHGPCAQYRLHLDARGRFSVVSFVWSPGQGAPPHDHRVWGLVGVLRGSEISQPFTLGERGLEPGPPARLEPGEVHAVSPRLGDIHTVTNALGDRPSISIHVYGADIGAVERSSFNAAAESWPFVSGYDDVLVAASDDALA